MNPVETYQESRMICPGCFYQKISQKVGCFIRGGRNGMGCFVRGDNTAWDVLSRVANLRGMFCPRCQKMAWDVSSQYVLSGSQTKHRTITDSHNGSNNKQHVNKNRTTALERTAA